MKQLLTHDRKVKFEIDDEIFLLYIDETSRFVTFVKSDCVNTIIIDNPRQYVDEYIAKQFNVDLDNVSIIETSSFNLLANEERNSNCGF